MTDVTLTVIKADVYDEVAKTTSYLGVKHQASGDEGSIDHYEQVFTTDADQLMLERFFGEAESVVNDKLKTWIDETTSHAHSTGVAANDKYEVKLKMPTNYDTELDDSVEASLFSYFSNYIVAKWCEISSPADSEKHGATAAVMLDDVIRKLRHRVRPCRPDCCGCY